MEEVTNKELAFAEAQMENDRKHHAEGSKCLCYLKVLVAIVATYCCTKMYGHYFGSNNPLAEGRSIIELRQIIADQAEVIGGLRHEQLRHEQLSHGQHAENCPKCRGNIASTPAQ